MKKGKSQKLERLENEISAMGYFLERQYVIHTGLGIYAFDTLDEVEKWIAHEELRRIGGV